jgi:hypothetical protein
MSNETPADFVPAEGWVLPLSEMRSTGVLWLINKVVFHPRGFALGLDVDDAGNVTGWTMIGDGSEPWAFGDLPDGTPIDDREFAKVEAFLDVLRQHAKTTDGTW